MVFCSICRHKVWTGIYISSYITFFLTAQNNDTNALSRKFVDDHDNFQAKYLNTEDFHLAEFTIDITHSNEVTMFYFTNRGTSPAI